MVADAEGAVLLEQLLLGILVVGVVVLLLPFLRFRSPAACAADRTSLRR
jgi:hypothetical protein